MGKEKLRCSSRYAASVICLTLIMWHYIEILLEKLSHIDALTGTHFSVLDDGAKGIMKENLTKIVGGACLRHLKCM